MFDDFGPFSRNQDCDFECGHPGVVPRVSTMKCRLFAMVSLDLPQLPGDASKENTAPEHGDEFEMLRCEVTFVKERI